MVGSDDSLAPVTYLFGASPEPVAPEPAAARPGEAQPVATDPTRDERRAHRVGLNALTRRGQSVAEMTALLESRELADGVVATEIERLTSVGLLDDTALAETLVRTLSERKGLGAGAIRQQLRQRKIASAAIDAALAALDDDDELERAIDVATKRAAQLRSYDQATAKRRLGAYLQRRGYTGSVLAAAMATALGAQPGPGPRFD